MKNYILLNYDYIFNDHMAKCSHQAKLYYIKLMFFANNGFVANPIEVLDSLSFDKGVFQELVANDELLTLPGRDEVFITAYFIHTNFQPMSWFRVRSRLTGEGNFMLKITVWPLLKSSQNKLILLRKLSHPERCKTKSQSRAIGTNY